MEIGQVCVKIAGRDSARRCVVVDIIDEKYVLIDGETRRRKCNVYHLEPLSKKLKVKKNASTEDVIKAFKTIDIEIVPKKASKKPTSRPTKQKVVKKQGAKETKKPAKKAAKSDDKKEKAVKSEAKAEPKSAKK